MALSLEKQMMTALPELRYQSSSKRVRVRLNGRPVADTTTPMLVWEPLRVVPSYAVPESDITANLVPAGASDPPPAHRAVQFGEGGPRLLDPGVPFAVHSADGEPLTVRVDSATRDGAAFRLGDPDLRGFVELDFAAFEWFEEDQQIYGHPTDPYHRIDIRPSSSHVRIEHQGTVLADTRRAKMLFEGTFPMARYYLPREDGLVDLLPGVARTTCAYKGNATHYSVDAGGQRLEDIAWSYENPLADARDVVGLVCFYQERLDLVVDGRPLERVRTPWS